MVGRADHQRVAREPVGLQRAEHLPDAVVQDARARVIPRHVETRLGRIRNWYRRLKVAGVICRRGLRILAMCFEEADVEKEGLLWRPVQKRHGAWRYVNGAGRLWPRHFVVSDCVRLRSYVLHTREHGSVSGVAQRVDDVLLVSRTQKSQSAIRITANRPFCRQGAAG